MWCCPHLSDCCAQVRCVQNLCCCCWPAICNLASHRALLHWSSCCNGCVAGQHQLCFVLVQMLHYFSANIAQTLIQYMFLSLCAAILQLMSLLATCFCLSSAFMHEPWFLTRFFLSLPAAFLQLALLLSVCLFLSAASSRASPDSLHVFLCHCLLQFCN